MSDVKATLPPLACRGVRGATVATANTADAILAATDELLQALIAANEIDPADVAAAFFTTTTDLDATYPALAARAMGWADAALLCGQEIDVPGGLGHCVRIMLLWNTPKTAAEIAHVYLYEAVTLRPDRGRTAADEGDDHAPFQSLQSLLATGRQSGAAPPEHAP